MKNNWCTDGRAQVLDEEDINNLCKFFEKHPTKSVEKANICWT